MGLLEREGESVSRKTQGGVSKAWGQGLKLQALGREADLLRDLRDLRPAAGYPFSVPLWRLSKPHPLFGVRRPSRVKDLFRVLESKETGNSQTFYFRFSASQIPTQCFGYLKEYIKCPCSLLPLYNQCRSRTGLW